MINSLWLIVITQLNLPYIVLFGPHYPHGFVPDYVSLFLSLTPQKTYDKLATNTLNKDNYQSLTRWCGIWQPIHLKEPDDPVGTTGQPARSALISNITARPNLLYIVRFGPYYPHGFVPDDASLFLSLTSQNTYDKLITNTLNKNSYKFLILVRYDRNLLSSNRIGIVL